MIKKIGLGSLAVVLSLGGDSFLKYGVHTNHAFMMKKGKSIVTLEYQKLNDTLDFFNIKNQELGDSASEYGSIGDMDGVKISGTYGYKENLTLNGNLKREYITYGDGTLINNRFEIFGKYNILYNEFSNTALSVDFGGIINKGENLKYGNTELLNRLGHKISNDFSLIEKKKQFYIVKSSSGDYLKLNEHPYLYINNMIDKNLYLKLITENRFASNSYLSFFAKYQYTTIDTKITANKELINKANEQGYTLNKDLGRDETALDLGFNIMSGTNYIFEFEYYWTRLYRDKGLGYVGYNHTINLDILKPLNKKWFIYMGGKIMYRQFNGDIPYLYNRYSQTTFDHKYGFARFGIGRSF